jgi:hypothetical protein
MLSWLIKPEDDILWLMLASPIMSGFIEPSFAIAMVSLLILASDDIDECAILSLDMLDDTLSTKVGPVNDEA